MRFCRRRMRAGAAARHGAQAVVGVGDAQPVVSRVNQVAALSSRRRDSGWFMDAPRKRLPSAKSAPVALERLEQAGDVGGAMLPVGVEGDDAVGALAQRVLDAGLQGGALPEIDRVLTTTAPAVAAARAGAVAEPSSTTTTS